MISLERDGATPNPPSSLATTPDPEQAPASAGRLPGGTTLDGLDKLILSFVLALTSLAWWQTYSSLIQVVKDHGITDWWQQRTLPATADIASLVFLLLAIRARIRRHPVEMEAWFIAYTTAAVMVAGTVAAGWTNWPPDPVAIGLHAWPAVLMVLGWHAFARSLEPVEQPAHAAQSVRKRKPAQTARTDAQGPEQTEGAGLEQVRKVWTAQELGSNVRLTGAAVSEQTGLSVSTANRHLGTLRRKQEQR